MKRFEVFAGDLLVSCSGTMGKVVIVPSAHKKGIINQALLKLTPDANKIIGTFLKLVLESDFIQDKYFKNQSGSAIQNVASVATLKTMKIPLPSLEIQTQLVAEAEKEEEIITANRRLIELMEGKIGDILKDV
jgi:type I restriction enzyme S subunit